MANEIVNYPDVSWPEVVAAALGYKDGITEEHLAQAVRQKLNDSQDGDTKPVEGWGTNDLADGAVTNAKMADGAVTSAKLGNGAVTSEKLASGAVTAAKLGGGYGVCSSLKATTGKIVTISGFVRTQNVPFRVKFSYDVQSGDTLNVRSSSSSSSGTGPCTLRWNGDNVPAGLITAGSVATLVFDGTYYQVLDVSPTPTALIVDGAITAEKVAAGVIPGWYYYASTSAYNTDAANVPNGSYVLIGTSQIILYRKISGSLSQFCAWPTGGGNVDNVVIVPIENNKAQLTPYIIYNELVTNGKQIMYYLYDPTTHALARLHKRPTTANDETATFIWEDIDNRQFVLYSLPASSLNNVTTTTVSFGQGSGSGPAIPSPTVADAGKILIVGATGAYELATVSTWNPGGSY